MSDSLFKKYINNKTQDFKDNELLNSLLKELKSQLKPVQDSVEKKIEQSSFSTGFVIGCPRSGTTLLMQWLASLGHFAYPTNLLARFAYAPYIGALMQEMLFNKEYDYNGDFFDIQSDINFKSNLGKSKGALAVNEFQHFFRNYTPNFDPEYLSSEQLGKVDFQGLKNGLASIEKVFEKPFITKAMMLQFNIDKLMQNMPNALFIYIKRDPIYNMQSIYLARLKYYDSDKIWWSVKPKEYTQLKNQDVYHQIAGQVYYTNRSIENQLALVSPQRKIKVDYDEFCNNPTNTYAKIKEMYSMNGWEMPVLYTGETSFNSQNISKIDETISKKLEEAYSDIVNKNI